MTKSLCTAIQNDRREVVDIESWRAHLLKWVSPDEIPNSDEILSGEELEKILARRNEPRFSVLVAGDVMLGDRTRSYLAEHGDDYPFQGVGPLMSRADIVFGNLEGPLARRAAKVDRVYSYRVKPESAHTLLRAGINAVTLANNHLLDCGRDGVLETIDTLESAGIASVGAGRDAATAHRPAILQAGSLRIGLLGYYWNRRCAAVGDLPGSAIDSAESLAADIVPLRRLVDRIVVAFHWGVPYERDPGEEIRIKARLAVDLGADAVVGHHPHVVQAFEVYRRRPIFYSVGNFAFGSGSSRSEGLLVGFNFEPDRTITRVYPIYVKNRDPRVAYQPKTLHGDAAMRSLSKLRSLSGAHGASLQIDQDRGVVELNRGDDDHIYDKKEYL
jgi:hypothetical protein